MVRTVTRKHTGVYSPYSYFKQKVTRAARSAVLILRRGAISLGAFIVWLLGLLTYLNVLPHLARILKPCRQLRKKSYEYSDKVTYLPGFRDRVVQFISTESANKKRLLRWVRLQCPGLQHVTDLSSQWCDGIALCMLVNAVVPSTCPRHDLLRKDHTVNNCRLAVRLIQRNLGIRETMMPEEMVDPKKINERKMMQYINSIQNASYIPVEEPETPIKLPEIGKQIELSTDNECTASGSGLVVAVIDKRARFNITTQTYISKNLYVEITGPNREKVRRKILTSKIGRGALVNANASQSSKDEPTPDDEGPLEPIPLDYQVIKPGSYQVNYIPRSLGIYQVTITWGGEHIKNSPFKVRSTTAKNIEQTTVKGVAKAVSFQEEQDAEHDGAEAVAGQNDSEGNSSKCRRQSLVRQPHISTIRDSYESTSTSPFSSMCSSMVSSMDHSIDNASDVFLPNHGHSHSAGNHPFFMSRHGSSVSAGSSRSGSILSRSSSIMYSTDRPPAVKTRRKVIRRIIKGAGGTEEVTYPNVRSSSVLSSSQMSSMTSSPSISTSMSIDDRSPKFSTSSSSSGASSSCANPSGNRTMPPPDRYADHMSKIIMGKALNEISKQVAMNLNSNRHTKDNQEPLEREGLTVKRTLAPPNDSGCQGSVQQLESQVKTKLAGPSPCVVDTTSKTGDQNVNTHNQPEKKETSADLENYLQTRKQFLQEIGSGSRPGESKQAVVGVSSDTSGAGSSVTNNSVSTSVKSTETTLGHSRRIHKKRKEDKATQCTAQDIKTATGWVSRRNVYRNAHINNRQKDSNGDSALGESEGSVANSSSEKDTAKAHSSKMNRVQADVVQQTQGSTHLRGSESSSRQIDSDQPGRFNGGGPVQRRGRSGTHSSQGRQSTFDSGFSDENGHITGHEGRCNTDEMRSRIISGLKTNGKKEGNAYSSQFSQSVPLMQVDRGVDMTTHQSNITIEEHAINVNEITTKQQSHSEQFHGTNQTHAIESLNNIPASSAWLPKDPDELDSSSPDNENEDSGPRQFLTVDCNACLDSSTAPTPGGSSVGNISSPDDEDGSGCKSNTSSDIPGDKTPPPFGEPSVETPYTEDSEALRELSLDAMLRTLENDPEYSTREFLRKYRPVLGDELGILAQLPDAEQIVTAAQESRREERDVASYHKDGSSTKEGSLTTPSQPIPERCHASGLGLYNGIVGDKNNFQVRTMSAGDGSLSVTIRGPRPHTVNETNVVYTGDDLYEVIYDVSLAGFYVISVRWADKHIPDSPFIVKITF